MGYRLIDNDTGKDIIETLNNLKEENNQLQSNWNSLREWLEVNDRYSQGYFKQVLEYMNELETIGLNIKGR